MSKSYVPAGTCIVCTSMTVSSPLKLVHIHNSTTFHKSENKALLNVYDRKTSDTFVCKNAQKFWGGLGTMLLGIAAGIIIGAAIVATAGTAAVVIVAVAATVAVAGVGAGIAGEVIARNDCDVIQSTDWKLFHAKVTIDGKNALLQSSILPCSKGGVVSIVADPVKAQQYAEIYANNNNAEVATHMLSQFAEGFISGVTFLGSPAAAIAGTGLGVYFYNKNESEGLDNQYKQLQGVSVPPPTFGGDLQNQLGQEAINQPVGAGIGAAETGTKIVKEQMIPTNQALNTQVSQLGSQAAALETEAAELAARGLTNEAAETAARAANVRLAQDIASRSYRMPWAVSGWRGLNLKPDLKTFGKGLGVGILGAAVNFGIEQWVNGMENDNFKNVFDQLDFLTKENNSSAQGINIIAING
ncbi:PAAR-like protein [Pedobacter vanadiisoli]|uniref:PAAR-like protein n=1 Tax=Pedobacter vanadiisoli TaxID=1761975 RepID=A0ABW5MND0_9SPHI